MSEETLKSFWEPVKNNEMITGAYVGLDWEELPEHAREDLESLIRAAWLVKDE